MESRIYLKILLEKLFPKQFIKILPGKLINLIRNKLLRKRRNTYPRKKLKFEIHLTEHCNLNCKGCDNFSSIADEEYLNINNCKKDFKRLSILFKNITEEILLLGGEPLLHPNIDSFFQMTRKYFPYATIKIVTNGILLLSKDDEFWKACKNNKIVVSITKYPIKIDFNKISQKAYLNDVVVEYFGSTKDIEKTLWKIPIDLKGEQNIESNFLQCHRANNCIFLHEGKLFTCSFAANVRHFNKFFKKEIPITSDDFIDIYQANDADEILSFLSRAIPMCKYCNLNCMEYGLEWGITEKKIEEWI